MTFMVPSERSSNVSLMVPMQGEPTHLLICGIGSVLQRQQRFCTSVQTLLWMRWQNNTSPGGNMHRASGTDMRGTRIGVYELADLCGFEPVHYIWRIFQACRQSILNRQAYMQGLIRSVMSQVEFVLSGNLERATETAAAACTFGEPRCHRLETAHQRSSFCCFHPHGD